jgi:Zn-finger nucleic acid-binding protein
VLDLVFGGVAVCPRCQGAWINQGTLDTAFGNPRWPQGQNMWWHAELEGPECATVGTRTKMDARSANDVMVDLCPSHGLWLDQGELGRLMGLEAGADELLELQKRVTAVAPDPEELAQRRLAWRIELDSRRRAASEFRSWVEQEQKRKAEEAAEAAKLRAVQAQAERRARKAEVLEAQQAAAQRTAAENQKRDAIQALGDERARLIKELRSLDQQMFAKREELVRMQGEIEVAKQRLREIDAQLDIGEPTRK